MADQWFVRVEGKEYGPVDLETLRAWRADGRLVPQNEVRRATDWKWFAADELARVFPLAEKTVREIPDDLQRPRSLGGIFGETFRIYRRGFLSFFALALLVAAPSFAMKVSLAFVHTPDGGGTSAASMIASGIAATMLLVVLFAWPIFVAGMQFGTADVAAGRATTFLDLVTRAIGVWARVARLSIAVYGSYVFWTLLPVFAIIAITGSEPSLLSLAIACFALALQVYMTGRLFINFLFWQQAATLGELAGVDALRESKELARSRPKAPFLERPLYRGAILASLWLVVLLAVSAAVELPFLIVRLQGISNVEELTSLAQSLLNSAAPDALTIAGYALSSLVHAALRPLLAISFVLLYGDAKSRR